jgi:transposase
VEKLIRIGMDTSKSVFQLHGVNSSEQPVLIKRLQRGQVLRFFKKLEPLEVGLEACGGSHYWARELIALGHKPRLVAPQHSKAYLRRGKHDAADAEAICEAMSRPRTRFVPVKSSEQQAAQMLAGVRDQLIRRRTQLSNTMRGYAAEFGLIATTGLAKIEPLLIRIATDDTVPALAKELFEVLADDYRAVGLRIEKVDARLMAFHRQDEVSRRLAQVPAIGPIGATLLSIKVPDAKAFRSGRDFAAWIGLTPKNHSTAGKYRLGAITRAGDAMLRRVLVVGAMAVIQQQKRRKEAPACWLGELLKRKSAMMAAVALANKTARIAWKLMVTGERYEPRPNQASVARCSAPSRPLRAADRGGRGPALTAPALRAPACR